MKKIAMLFLMLFMLSGVCSAQGNGFTFLGQNDGVSAFLYEDDIRVTGDLYMFHLVVRDSNNSTTTVLTVIANKRERWYVYAGATVELPDGNRYNTEGDATMMYYGDNSPVDMAILYIDSRKYLTWE